ncbi:hypothetical protein BH09DEP1_BH09DEP1_3190 [soil metagenome]
MCTACMNNARRKFDPEDIATQMAKVRRVGDIRLINSITTAIKSQEELPKGDLDLLITQEDRALILHGILASGKYESEWFSALKNKLLVKVMEQKGYSNEHSPLQLKNMDTLLKDGADPETKKTDSCDKLSCLARASFNPAALIIFLKNGCDANALFDERHTLLIQATKECSQSRWEDYTKETKERVNILLFFGADMQIRISNQSVFDYAYEVFRPTKIPELIKHAHARRVNRLAGYLARCMHMHIDITLIIAQHHYGRLSDEDKKLIATYPPYDYQKIVA